MWSSSFVTSFFFITNTSPKIALTKQPISFIKSHPPRPAPYPPTLSPPMWPCLLCLSDRGGKQKCCHVTRSPALQRKWLKPRLVRGESDITSPPSALVPVPRFQAKLENTKRGASDVTRWVFTFHRRTTQPHLHPPPYLPSWHVPLCASIGLRELVSNREKSPAASCTSHALYRYNKQLSYFHSTRRYWQQVPLPACLKIYDAQA